jgi:hypothetical protein
MFAYEHDMFLIHYACDCERGEVRLSDEHSSSRWIDPQQYRDEFFSEQNVAKLEAAHAGAGAMARSVQKGIDDYLDWMRRCAR